MPAFAAGFRNRPAESEAATTTGLFQKTSGSASGTQLQAFVIASEPVRIRSMTRGAAIAPSSPKTPDAVSTRPICTGAKPAWTSRRIAANSSALISRLSAAENTMSTRKSGRAAMNPKPSTRPSLSLGRGSSAAAVRSARMRPSSTQDTA
jgi:hypothetical protein